MNYHTEKRFGILLLLIVIVEVKSTENTEICNKLCKCSKSHSVVPGIPSEEGMKLKCGGETKISSIEELHFDSIFSRIIQLNLSGNNIAEIPSGAFTNLNNLQKLDLSRNLISKVEAGAFLNLTSLKRLDLSANKIGRLGYNVFEGLENLEKLKINQNWISRLSEGIFDNLYALKQLDISDNPLHCDCQLAHILTWVQNSSIKLPLTARCNSPPPLRGQLLRKLHPDRDLRCDSEPQNLLELRPSHDQVVFEGDSLQLHCRAPGVIQDNGATLITWVRDDGISEDGDGIIENSSLHDSGLVESSISIQQLSPEHSGKWNCMLVSSQGNQSQAITLIVISKETTYCPQTVTSNNKGVYVWPKTVVGHTVIMDCQGGSQQAQYDCTSNGSWDNLNTSLCPYISHVTNILEQFTKVNLTLAKPGVLESARRLKNFTSNAKLLKDKMDIVFISETINNYLRFVPKEKELGAILVDIISSLMKIPPSLMAAAQMENKACTNLVNAVELLAESVPMPSHKSNLAVEKFPVKKEDFTGMTCRWYDHSGKIPSRLFICTASNSTSLLESKVIEASVQVPSSLFYQLEKQGHSVSSSRQLLVSVYENNWLFPSITQNSSQVDKDVTSCVIGAKLAGTDVSNLTEPVFVMLRAPLTGDSPRPVWWDGSMNGGAGGWSTTGCQLSHLLHGLLVFQCDRLGYFGLLQSTGHTSDYVDRTPGAKFRYSHPTIYFGCFVTVVCLLTAIVTYIICYDSIQMSKKSKHSLVNTWIAMTFLCFMFSIGIYQTEDIKICQSVGLLLHYLSLCSLLWMAVGVSHTHKRLSRPPETTDTVVSGEDDTIPPDGPIPEPLLGLYLVGWGVALIVCGISGAVNLRDYAGRRHCFLAGGPALGAVAVPCCAVTVLLGVLLALAARAASARAVESDPGEGTQATENLDLDTLTPPPLPSTDRDSYRSEDTSEAEDGERAPAAQVRAQAVMLALFLASWGSAAAATVCPIPGFPRQEALFGTFFGLAAAALGLFVVTFYCVGRRDVRIRWAELRQGAAAAAGGPTRGRVRGPGRCCRTRSVSDAAPIPVALPVTQNSIVTAAIQIPCRKAVETNGVAVHTVAKTDDKRGPTNVNVVLLPRQPGQYVMASGVASDPSGGVSESAEMFYNPRQSTVARKFFRKQRRHAAGLAARRSGGVGVASDTDTRAESAVFLSSDMENASSNVAASLPRVDYSWPVAQVKRHHATGVAPVAATSSAAPVLNDDYAGAGDRLGPPLERLVIGAEESNVKSQNDNTAGANESNCLQSRATICSLPEVEEPTASSVADLSDMVSSDREGGSVSGADSLACGTGSGALGAPFDTDGDRSSWREEGSELGSELTMPESSLDSVSADLLGVAIPFPIECGFESSVCDSEMQDSFLSAPIVVNGDREGRTCLSTLRCDPSDGIDFDDQLVNKKETSV